ncbi:MAG: DUF6106 family protein [Defluviitaleaceae bacterium]|nr:DUF6106 family protein [Defluviitaleaceae bacterium]
MRDVFNEQLVKKRPTMADTAKKAGLIAACVLIGLISFYFFPGLAVFILAAAIFGTYWLFRRMNIEYEYVYTNGELDIDIIYAKAKRKRLFSGDTKDFEIMCAVLDTAHQRDLENVRDKPKRYYSGVVDDSTYAFIASYKGKRSIYVIEPDAEMLEAISSTVPKRKFFKR